jgi:transposase
VALDGSGSPRSWSAVGDRIFVAPGRDGPPLLEAGEAALVLEQGMSQRQVCHAMGVSKSALQVWVRDAELQRRGMTPAAPGDLEAQRGQAQLLKRIRELEKEILQWASAYLSHANLRVGSVSPK